MANTSSEQRKRRNQAGVAQERKTENPLSLANTPWFGQAQVKKFGRGTAKR